MITIEQLWQERDFRPNDQQRAAILHVDGPLYLPAGPGSGKTRVLLWRTVNLIVFHGVKPDEIYLSTFTEKAARQLREGLRSLLGLAAFHTHGQYDISRMYVGTIHALCQQLVQDRRFYPNRHRGSRAVLLDELSQYFHVYGGTRWASFIETLGLGEDAAAQLNSVFGEKSASRHKAVTHCLSLFNRLSEECLDPATLLSACDDSMLRTVLEFYQLYRQTLQPLDQPRMVDFSLLQQDTLSVLMAFDGATQVFKHVIVDEYQDTNTVQERIFFRLATGSKNICVVGDDDQALYRFRGATVENFVDFPTRCHHQLNIWPAVIPLAVNYRSRKKIVDFYTTFMTHADWARTSGPGAHRVLDKNIRANSSDDSVTVVASAPTKPEDVCTEISELVRNLLDTKRVEDPSQIAFLFPSLKSTSVERMKSALEAQGLRVYAPRAGRFIEVDEATSMFGLYLHIFGKPSQGPYGGSDYAEFHDWIDRAHAVAIDLMDADSSLERYVRDRQQEIAVAVADYTAIAAVIERQHWALTEPYRISQMEPALLATKGLSDRARKNLQSAAFKNAVRRREQNGQPFTLNYIVTSVTSLDWNVLDLFYRLCGFQHFKNMFDLAAKSSTQGGDEGPICNLGLISQYLARFMDEYASVIRAAQLKDDKFQVLFFMSYLFALFRLGESEYENAEDPFPRGRIPFLTIHQSKGLEFPVVILGNPRKGDKTPPMIEQLVQPFLSRNGQGEPLDRMAEFDVMRMFYVALSRAKNLLVIAHFKGQGQTMNKPFKAMLDSQFPRIADLDVESLPEAKLDAESGSHNYSYTADYLLYQKCPRQYMVFRKYGFVPSRSQTMMFGNLVHRTMEDLHQFLIAHRGSELTPLAEATA